MSENRAENTNSKVLDALVLGAGFGGVQMLHDLRERGMSAIALEAGDDVGGAWYWNRYPGARCDVESLVYCYSFSPIIDAEWHWSERYAAQPEIRAYIGFVVDRLDLRKDIRFNSTLVKAQYDEATNLWTFETEHGATYQARYFISAAGPISAPIWPDIPNRDAYKGQLLHSAMWPRDVEPDFTGKRVGVIGTGSSGTQLIPLVARQAGELFVFVRTSNLYMPALNRPLSQEDRTRWDGLRDTVRSRMRSFEIVGSGDVFHEEELHELRKSPGTAFTPEQRRHILERRLAHGGANVARAFSDVLTNDDINEEVCEFIREQVAVVENPGTAELLTPRGFPYGTKRITIGTDYYETYNRDNVVAIDAKNTPIERFTEKGVVIDGKEIELDAVICATGFDAVTGALTALDIRGEGGRSIKDVWADNCDTYLGFGIADFPNLLMIGGPGSPSVLVNVLVANDFQVEWIGRLLETMRDNGLDRIAVDPKAQQRWAQTVKDVIKGTVMAKAKSWYVGANVPGKTQGILAYAGGLAKYIGLCEDCASTGYAGFELSSSNGSVRAMAVQEKDKIVAGTD